MFSLEEASAGTQAAAGPREHPSAVGFWVGWQSPVPLLPGSLAVQPAVP